MEKPSPDLTRNRLGQCPHSLGKLIEWKRFGLFCFLSYFSRPHSLGKLIEWKRQSRLPNGELTLSPHSLGKLIEWKI